MELFNPDPEPVALDGLYLTDQPWGLPFQQPITPLSFIAGYGYRSFVADGNTSAGADHVNFRLAQELGEIGLLATDGTLIDYVSYGLQNPDISQGRSPNGGDQIAFFTQPTPGAGNPVVPGTVPPLVSPLIPLDGTFQWKYNDTGTDLGTAWRSPSYNDASWSSGPGMLGSSRGVSISEPLRTSLSSASGKSAFYFRCRFNYDTNLEVSTIQLSHLIDDGAVFYLNGVEVYRYNMPSGTISYSTPSANNILDATFEGPVEIPLNDFQPGENVMAVEVHNSNTGSPDMYLAVKLDAVIVTNNPAAAGVLITEVMANNRSVTNGDGTITDWIELYNPSSSAVDLGGMSLSDQLTLPQRWVFPSGSIIAGRGYYTVALDGGTAASASNTGFGLKETGDAIYLFDQASAGGALLDGLTFGIQAPDLSLGRVPLTSTNWVLTLPTMGTTNLAATLGDLGSLKVNEWMASPLSGNDWFEIYNPNPQPVELSGLHLTDDLNNRLQHTIAARSFIAAGLEGFQVFIADSDLSAGADHVNFHLAASGESIGIATATGDLIDAVTFGPQAEGVSEGRLPDGSATMTVFPVTATPGKSNYLPINDVVINEVLTHSDPPLEDAIELHNVTANAIDISGWYLSDARTFPKKFRIPDNTILAGNGYVVFYEYQFNAVPGDPASFALSSAKGDEVYLSATGAGGNLTGYREVENFGPAQNGVSFGRYATSVDTQFVPMSQRTFGVDQPETLADFRTGTGAPNADPNVGPVVISEIMYHPPDLGSTNDNTRDEFIELQNIGATSVPLFDPAHPTNTWRLRGAVKFDFPPDITLPPGETVLIVGFDPVADAGSLTAFQTAYGLSNGGTIFGPFSGKLANSSDRIELQQPDTPQAPGTADAGLVPYFLVEQVAYSDTFPWPAQADGTGLSLQRITVAEFGNDPANWQADTPTPGPLPALVDTDHDGMPDTWENDHGLSPTDPSDANTDLDHDGATNLQEYLAGTDPTDPQSVFRLNLVPGATLTLHFTAEPNKAYTIEYRDGLDASSPWQVLTNIEASASQQVIQIPDVPGSASRFYRLSTPQ